jgi:hypothetical protein
MSKNKSNKSPKSSQLRSDQQEAPDKPVSKSAEIYEEEIFSDNSRLISDEKGFTLIEAHNTYKQRQGGGPGIHPGSENN